MRFKGVNRREENRIVGVKKTGLYNFKISTTRSQDVGAFMIINTVAIKYSRMLFALTDIPVSPQDVTALKPNGYTKIYSTNNIKGLNSPEMTDSMRN